MTTEPALASTLQIWRSYQLSIAARAAGAHLRQQLAATRLGHVALVAAAVYLHAVEHQALRQVSILRIVRVFVPALLADVAPLALVAAAVVLVKPDLDVERVTMFHHLAQ